MALHLKNSHFSIFFCILLCKFVASDSDRFGSCLTEYNETVNSQTGLHDDPYRINLIYLFSNFTASSSSFYNTTTGESPNKAYGLYLCRPDVSSDTCHSCIADLTKGNFLFLSNCKEGITFSYNCMLRYANYSFFGIANDKVSGMFGKYTEPPSREYNQTLGSVLAQVVNYAPRSSATLFSTSEASVTGTDEKVYGLAQCTPDISRKSCSACLKVASDYLQPNLTKGGMSKAAWAFLPSCQLRYDNVSSFDFSPAGSMASPTVSAFLLGAWSPYFFFFSSLFIVLIN